jgi:heme exporter protein C
MIPFLHFLHKIISPKYCYQLAGYFIPWLGFICFMLMGYGVWSALFLVPADYQQGDAFRIIYVHVPTAFLSLGIYTIIFFNSVLYLIWRIKIADIVAEASAIIGATYTLIALFSGALWGKPMWGTWWIWDARLTSELILLFLYLGYMGLRSAIHDSERRAKASAILAMVGMVDIPIVHFSVSWWATLHQGATLSKFAKPSIAPEMLYPLLVMIVAFFLFYLTLLLVRVRSLILKREWRSQWVQEIAKGDQKIQLDFKSPSMTILKG